MVSEMNMLLLTFCFFLPSPHNNNNALPVLMLLFFSNPFKPLKGSFRGRRRRAKLKWKKERSSYVQSNVDFFGSGGRKQLAFLCRNGFFLFFNKIGKLASFCFIVCLRRGRNQRKRRRLNKVLKKDTEEFDVT